MTTTLILTPTILATVAIVMLLIDRYEQRQKRRDREIVRRIQRHLELGRRPRPW